MLHTLVLLSSMITSPSLISSAARWAIMFLALFCSCSRSKKGTFWSPAFFSSWAPPWVRMIRPFCSSLIRSRRRVGTET